MQIKTKFNNLLTKNSDKFYNCINVDNELMQNVHNIYKKKYEKDIKTFNLLHLNELCDINSSNLNKMCNENDICVSLKLKLKIKNNNEEDNQSYSIYFDINPEGIMSKNQKKIYYQYKNTTEKNDEYFEKVPKEEKMKYFSSLSYKLAGKIIQYKQSKYKLVNLLQSAIYGSVYLSEVIEDSDKSLVNCQKAIKILSKHLIEMTKDKVQEDPLSEYYYRDTMSGHSNILSCDNIFDDNSYIYMVMPFALHGDLFEVMKNRNRAFSEEEGRYLFYQILLAIKFLHSKRMALRDISLENVLLFENEKNGLIYPVLNDPGQAIYFNVNNRNEVILEEYKKIFGKIFRPPEIYEKCKYDPTKVDIFCAGYILYFCLTKHELFRCTLNKDVYWNLLKNKKYEELLKDKKGLHLSEEALDLIFHCLEPNFKKRYTITEALNHPWFKGNFFPIYNFNLYLNNETSSKYNNDGSFKLSLEIQEYAKKNNMKIDKNSTIQFYVYEHVFISPSKNLEKQNKCINTLKYSYSNNKREYNEDIKAGSILTYNDNNNNKNKTIVININNNNKRNSVMTTRNSTDISYINNHVNNDFTIKNSNDDADNYVVDIDNKEVYYKKLFGNSSDLNQTSKIKILNNHKKNIYRLIELKKKKKLFSTSIGINYLDKKCSSNKMSIKASHKVEENILINKKGNIFNTKKNDENVTPNLLLENQLKRKNQLSKNIKNEKNIISLIKHHFKENMNKRNSYNNTKQSIDKYNSNKYTTLNEIKERKKNLLKDTTQDKFLNERNVIKKNKELFEENQKYNILYKKKNTEKYKNNNKTLYGGKLEKSETTNNAHVQNIKNAKNNNKSNILSNIENEVIKYDSFESHKKKFTQINGTNKNIAKENKLLEIINNNILNKQKKNKDTNNGYVFLTQEKYIENILNNKIISNVNNENSKEEINSNAYDISNVKDIKTINYKNTNCVEKKIIKNNNLKTLLKQNNGEIHSNVIYKGKKNELNEKKKLKNNNLKLFHNINHIDNTILLNESFEKSKNKKEKSIHSKKNDLNMYCSSYPDTHNKIKNSLLINSKINSCKKLDNSKDKEQEKMDEKLSFKELKVKNKFTDLRKTYNHSNERNSFIITKNDANLLKERKMNPSCANKNSLFENILEKKIVETPKNITITESKENFQVELEKKLEEKSDKTPQSELENSQDKLESEIKNEEIKSKDILQYELENELENVIKNEENNLEDESENDFNMESSDLINELNDELIDEIGNSSNEQGTELKEILESKLKLKDEYGKELENELKIKQKDNLQNDLGNITKIELSVSFENSLYDQCDKMLIHKGKQYMDKEKLNIITDNDLIQNKQRYKSYIMNNKNKRNLSCKLPLKTKSSNKTKRGNYSYNSGKISKILTSKKFFHNNSKKCIYNNKLKDHNYESSSTSTVPKENSSFINLKELESKNYNKRNANIVNKISINIDECKNKKSYPKIKFKINDSNKKNILGRHTISEYALIYSNKKKNNVTNILESNNKLDKIMDDNKKKDKVRNNKKEDKVPLIHNFRNTVDISHYSKKRDTNKIKDSRTSENPSFHLIKESYNKKDILKENTLNDNIKNRSILNISYKSNMKNINSKIKKKKNLINKNLEEKTSNLKKNTNLETNKNISNKKNIEEISKKNFKIDINSKLLKKRKRYNEFHKNKISNEFADLTIEEIKKSKFDKLKRLKNRCSLNELKKLTRENLNKNNEIEKCRNKMMINLNEKKRNLNDNINKMNIAKNVNVNNDISNCNCNIKRDNQNNNEALQDKRTINFKSSNDNINEMKNIKGNNLKNSDKWDLSLYKKKYIHSNNINHKTTNTSSKSLKSRQTIVYPFISPNETIKKDSLLLKRNSNILSASCQKITNIKKIINVEKKKDNEKNLSNKYILDSFLNKMNENFEKKNEENKINTTNSNINIENKKENNKNVKIEKVTEMPYMKKTNTSNNINNLSNNKEKNNGITQVLNEIYKKKNENNELKSYLSKNDIKNKEDKMKTYNSLRETTNLPQTKLEDGSNHNNLELFDTNFSYLKQRKTYENYKNDIKNKINNIENGLTSYYNEIKEQYFNEKEKKNNNFNKKEQENVSPNFEEKNFFLKNIIEIDKGTIDGKNNLKKTHNILNEIPNKQENLLHNLINSNNDHSGNHIERIENNEQADNNNNNTCYKNSENNIEINNKKDEVSSRKNEVCKKKNDEINNTKSDRLDNDKNNNTISHDNYSFYTNKKSILGNYKVYNNSDDYLKIRNKDEVRKLQSIPNTQINSSFDKHISVIDNNKIIKGRNTFNVFTTEFNKNKLQTYLNNKENNLNCVNMNCSNKSPYRNNLKEIKKFNYNLKTNSHLNNLKESNGNKAINLRTYLNCKKMTNNQILLNNTPKNSTRNNNECENFLMKPNLYVPTNRVSFNKLGNAINKISDAVKSQYKIKAIENSENITSLNISNLKNYNTNDLCEKKDAKKDSNNKSSINIVETKYDYNNNSSVNNNIFNRKNDSYFKKRTKLNIDNIIFDKNRKTSSSVAIDKSHLNLTSKNVSPVKSINDKQFYHFKNKLQNNVTSNEEFQIYDKTKNLSSKNKISIEKDSRNIHMNDIYLKSNTNETKIKSLLYKNVIEEDQSYSQSTLNKVYSHLNPKETRSNIEYECQKQKITQNVFSTKENKKYKNHINNTMYLDPMKLSLNLNKISYMNNKVKSSKNCFFVGLQENKNTKENQNKKVQIKNKYNEMINLKKNENITKNINTCHNDLLYKNSLFYVNKKNEELISKDLRLVNTLEKKKLTNENYDMHYSIHKNEIDKIEINKNNNKNNENDVVTKSNILQNINDINNNSTINNIKQSFYLNKMLNIKEYIHNNALYHLSNKKKIENQKENCKKITKKKNNLANLLNTHIFQIL
ncbi:protein kinase, putative [Plasmodium relictum]|uniref:Protein kinase, putative n=1 Tax=Plasmodium relictum TaxID=85471 RepID=A0A1J1H4H7_PLARL|nr:protein kinase, putative [Plasmodium relictum]CRG99815.1 protein kinase, putative [Plasmodium relictum]